MLRETDPEADVPAGVELVVPLLLPEVEDTVAGAFDFAFFAFFMAGVELVLVLLLADVVAVESACVAGADVEVALALSELVV